MNRILSKTELVLIEVLHPVLFSAECLWTYLLHRGVILAHLLILTQSEFVWWLDLILLVLRLIGSLMVLSCFWVNLLIVNYWFVFSRLVFAWLELMNPDSMGLELKNPLGMRVLLITLINVTKLLVQRFHGLNWSFLDATVIVRSINDGLIKFLITVDKILVVRMGLLICFSVFWGARRISLVKLVVGVNGSVINC